MAKLARVDARGIAAKSASPKEQPSMELAHFLTVRGPAAAAERLAGWFQDGPAAALAGLGGVDYLDLYTPSRTDHTDPYIEDRDGPALMVQTGHADLAAVAAMLTSPAFAAAADLDASGVPGLRATHDVMRREFFAVAGEDAPRPMSAPLSFVVRYHGPCADPALFTRHYREGHATGLARLPAVRNVLVYARTDWDDPTAIARADYLLGNEVVFDSIDALNAALNSPARHEMREHVATFPGWSGHNTHYAMDRARLAAKRP